MPHHTVDPARKLTALVEQMRGSGLSYGQIAEMSGVSRGTAWRIGTGMFVDPSDITARRIIEAHDRLVISKRLAK